MSLILTRRNGEEIIIDNTIAIKVLKISNRYVSIAIDAPSYMAVDRLEIHQKKNSHTTLSYSSLKK